MANPGLGLVQKPVLTVKEIGDLYLRQNFQSLSDYFRDQNQLMDFLHFEVVFTGAEQNRRVTHGLGKIPRDVIKTAIIGSGVVRLERALFDSKYLFLSATGPVTVRFFAGNYWKDQTGSNPKGDEYEEWSATVSTSSSSTTSAAPAWAPSGAIIMWPSNTEPDGWLRLDGTEGTSGVVLIADYPEIYDEIGTAFGGDGLTTFGLPNYAGLVPRGAGSQTISGKVYTTTIQATQQDALQGHIHAKGTLANAASAVSVSVSGNTDLVTTFPSGASNTNGAVSGANTNGRQITFSGSGTGTAAAQVISGSTAVPSDDGTNGTPRTASETRGANLGTLFIMKI